MKKDDIVLIIFSDYFATTFDLFGLDAREVDFHL
jgi:hypothetical protein